VKAAQILLLIGGLLVFIEGLVLLVLNQIPFSTYFNYFNDFLHIFGVNNEILLIILGVLLIIASFLQEKKSWIILALVVSIFSLFGKGGFALGSLLALAGASISIQKSFKNTIKTAKIFQVIGGLLIIIWAISTILSLPNDLRFSSLNITLLLIGIMIIFTGLFNQKKGIPLAGIILGILALSGVSGFIIGSALAFSGAIISLYSQYHTKSNKK
jgi:hypothetical protein